MANIRRALQVRTHFELFLTELEEFVKESLSKCSIPQAQLYLSGLQDKYKHFLKSQSEIEAANDTELDSDIRVVIDKKYYKLRPALETRILEIK